MGVTKKLLTPSVVEAVVKKVKGSGLHARKRELVLAALKDQ
jgi:hypothetical protein